jgi:hypothetical protein
MDEVIVFRVWGILSYLSSFCTTQKQVAVRVFEDHEISRTFGSPRIPLSPQPKKAGYFPSGIGSVQIQMPPTSLRLWMIALLKAEIRAAPFRVGQYYPSSGGGLARNVVERTAPGFDHAVKFEAVELRSHRCAQQLLEQLHDARIPACDGHEDA